MIKKERKREREKRRIPLARSGTDVIKRRCDGCWKIRWVRVLSRPGSTGINQPEEFLQFSHTTVIIMYMGRCSWRSSSLATVLPAFAGWISLCDTVIFIYMYIERAQSPLYKIRYKSFGISTQRRLARKEIFIIYEWKSVRKLLITTQPTRNKSRRYIHMQINRRGISSFCRVIVSFIRCFNENKNCIYRFFIVENICRTVGLPLVRAIRDQRFVLISINIVTM